MSIIHHKFQYASGLKKFARSLRKNQTNTESFLWNKLRGRQMAGYKFKRQFPLDGHIIDFYCYEKKLAIELDGGQHSFSTHIVYDRQRTSLLKKHGITLIRFWDNEVFKNTSGVLEEILRQLQGL